MSYDCTRKLNEDEIRVRKLIKNTCRENKVIMRRLYRIMEAIRDNS